MCETSPVLLVNYRLFGRKKEEVFHRPPPSPPFRFLLLSVTDDVGVWWRRSLLHRAIRGKQFRASREEGEGEEEGLGSGFTSKGGWGREEETEANGGGRRGTFLRKK